MVKEIVRVKDGPFHYQVVIKLSEINLLQSAELYLVSLYVRYADNMTMLNKASRPITVHHSRQLTEKLKNSSMRRGPYKSRNKGKAVPWTQDTSFKFF